MPEVIGETSELMNLWAYKYDNHHTDRHSSNAGGDSSAEGEDETRHGALQHERQKGVKVHTDLARANLNLWVTPDAANLDPTSGGMTVYDVAANSTSDFLYFQVDDPPQTTATSGVPVPRICSSHTCFSFIVRVHHGQCVCRS